MVDENNKEGNAVHRIAEKKREEILGSGEESLKAMMDMVLPHLVYGRGFLPSAIEDFVLIKSIEIYVGEFRQGAVSRIYYSHLSDDVGQAAEEAIKIIVRAQFEGLEGEKFEKMARFLEWDVIDGAIPMYTPHTHEQKTALFERGGTPLSKIVRDIAQELRNSRNPLAKDGELLNGTPKAPASVATKNGNGPKLVR